MKITAPVKLLLCLESKTVQLTFGCPKIIGLFDDSL